MSDTNEISQGIPERAQLDAKDLSALANVASTGAQLEVPDWINKMYANDPEMKQYDALLDPNAPNPGEGSEDPLDPWAAIQTPAKAAEVRDEPPTSAAAQQVAKNIALSQQFGASDFNIPPTPKQ